VNDALAADTPAAEIVNKGLIFGIEIVGGKMESDDMFIPEVLMAVRGMGECVTILIPLLGEDDSSTGARVVRGTID